MAATYSQSAAWKNSSDCIDRVTIAVFKYAQYLIGQAGNATLKQGMWARNAYQAPGGVAAGFLSAVAFDAGVMATLPTAPTDAVLQTATETAINATLGF
jgi:hypothetical protein